MKAEARSPEGFKLESPAPAGEIPQRVIDELVRTRSEAKGYAQAFADAIKAQAEKYGLRKSALRKYICAIEADKVEDAKADAEALADLIG